MKTTFKTIGTLSVVAALLSLVAFGSEVESSTPTPKEEVQLLMDEGLPFAEERLREDGEFLPFGVVLTIEGQIRQVAVPKTNKRRVLSNPESLFSRLRGRARNGQFVAVALFTDSQVQDPRSNEEVSVVKVGLEHVDGYCANILIPYALPLEEIDLGEVMVTKRSGEVFDSCQ